MELSGSLMQVPSNTELIHYKIQAAMREHHFNEDQMKYLGERDGEHWYRIGGEHEVPVSALEEFEFLGEVDPAEEENNT